MNVQGAPAPSPPAPQPGEIPRVIYLGRLLGLCFYPLAAVILGDAVLLGVPQAREALRAFGDDGDFATQAAAFFVAFGLWMTSAWYVSHLLVGRRFKPDLIGSCSKSGFASGATKWLPRALALLASLPIAIDIAVSESAWLGVLLIVFSLAVLTGLVFRRQLAERRHQGWVLAWRKNSGEDIERFDTIATSGVIYLSVLGVVGIALWLAIPIFMEPFARLLGTPAILLFALMSWTVFGGILLTYLPKALHLTGWSWGLVVLALLFYPLNENHRVTDGKYQKQQVAGVPDPNNPRNPVEVAFNQWLSQRSDPRAPVILVATAGGASRAAYWTASSLGKLEDELAPRGSFSRNIFAISSISGGSLGAAAFVSAIEESRHHPGPRSACNSVRSIGTEFTGRDHLATIVGMMLFPDLLDRFLPFRLHFWDRSRGLEEVWASDWARMQRSCADPKDAVNPWSQAFLQLHFNAGQGAWLPMLALNSTALDAGRPVLQADFLLSRSDAFDLLSGQFATGDLTLAEAVHNSARFPYISPGGEVKLWDTDQSAAGAVWDRLGDGGYVEASGTLTLSEMIRTLRARNLVRSDSSQGACVTKDGQTSCFITDNQLKILVLDNTPAEARDWLCGDRQTEQKDGLRAGNLQNIPGKPKPLLPVLPDLTLPLDGAFSTRGGRAVTSQVDLLELVGGCTAQFAELRLPKPPKGTREPSMNWMLDKQSRDQIDAVLNETPGTDSTGLVADNLKRIRAWLDVTTTTSQ